jgi:hypothetical protein
MAHVTYKVVRHEDGWAYTVNAAFSESFPTHAEALEAARHAAAEKPGEPLRKVCNRQAHPNPRPLPDTTARRPKEAARNRCEASRGTFSAGSSLICANVLSSSARRCSVDTSAAPKRMRLGFGQCPQRILKPFLVIVAAEFAGAFDETLSLHFVVWL